MAANSAGAVALVTGAGRGIGLEVARPLNHYERKDGEPVMRRAVTFTDRNEAGQENSIRLYADVAPLFAPAE